MLWIASTGSIQKGPTVQPVPTSILPGLLKGRHVHTVMNEHDDHDEGLQPESSDARG